MLHKIEVILMSNFFVKLCDVKFLMFFPGRLRHPRNAAIRAPDLGLRRRPRLANGHMEEAGILDRLGQLGNYSKKIH